MTVQTVSLIETIQTKLASNDLRLLVYSSVAAELQAIAARPDSTVDQVAAVLRNDPTLASHILRIANSSFYARLSRVTTIEAAMMRLGLQQIVDVAVLCIQRDQYQSRDLLVAGYMQRLWRHALASALGAKWLAQRQGWRAMASEAFMAGLFHDIGALLVLMVCEDVRATRRDTSPIPENLILEVVDSMHAELGTRLILAWNLPEAYATVAQQHHATDAENATPLTRMVRVFDAACQRVGLDLATECSIAPATSADAVALDIDEVTLAELEVVLEDSMPQLGG